MRLRLHQYQQDLITDDAAQLFSQVLSESQPPYKVSGAILREWYIKFHPDSGPLKYATTEALEVLNVEFIIHNSELNIMNSDCLIQNHDL